MSFKTYIEKSNIEMREITQQELDMYKNEGGLFFQDGPDPFNSKLVAICIDRKDKLECNSPKLGDMIARNPNNHKDQWLVPEEEFCLNFEQEFVPEVMSTQIPDGETAESMSKKINNVFEHGMYRNYEIKPSTLRSDKDFNGLLLVGKGTFGMAIEAVKRGKKVARAGWNGKDMFVYYVPAAAYPAMTEVGKEIAKLGIENKVQYREYLALKTAQGDIATWAPSGSDALAEDWMIVE